MDGRPVFLNLLKIKLPLSGLVSILHRISGVLFFLGLPILIYMYQVLPTYSNGSNIYHIGFKVSVWLLIVAFQYHFLAGVRHMISDFFHMHSLKSANLSAIVVLLLAVFFAIWSGVLVFGVEL